MTPSLEPLYPSNSTINAKNCLTIKAQTLLCRVCEIPLPVASFTRDSRSQRGRASRCKDCTKTYYDELERRHAAIVGLATEKICTVCHVPKPFDDFYKAKWSKDGRHNRCKLCFSGLAADHWKQSPRPAEINRKKNKDWREVNSEHTKAKRLQRKLQNYGVVDGWYEQQFDEQDGKCAICGSETPRINGGKYFAIDHDHACCPTSKVCGKCVRGLLCGVCNSRLGILEDVEWVAKAQAYLRGYMPITSS